MTIAQWANLPNNEKVGNFWVIDHQTGWAYWANRLRAGEATSYLLDAAEMTAETDTIPGEYYYGIHVDSQLISSDRTEEFLGTDSEGAHHADLPDFLDAVRTGSIDNNWGNPGPDEDSQPGDFNFDRMVPGNIFTMAGEQYRYLENMGNGNHMIIRDEPIRDTSFVQQNSVLTNFYNNLTEEVRALVQPVSIPAVVPGISLATVVPWGGEARWIPAEWEDTRFNDVRNDRTAVNSAGTPQAFALSFADVVHLSTETGPFPSFVQRVAAHTSWWWTRTPTTTSNAWALGWAPGDVGRLNDFVAVTHHSVNGGVRPALIISQSN